MAKFLAFFHRGDVQALTLMGIRGTSLVMKFALTLFIARYMGFEELGMYGLIVSATFLVPAFSGLGIMYMKTRNAVMQPTEQIVKGLYHFWRYLLVLYAFIIVVAGVLGYYSHSFVLSLLMVSVVFFEHINNDLYGLLLNRSKALSANMLHFIRTSVWILFFMVCAFLFSDFQTLEFLLLLWWFGGLAAFIGFLWIAKDWGWKQQITFPPLLQWVRSELKESKTIYVHSMVDGLGHHMNHFLVTAFLGLELTGVYVYFMQIVNALSNLIRTGIIQQSRPKFIQAKERADNSLRALYRKCLKNSVLASFCMGGIALPIMYFITDHIVDKPLALEWFSILGINLIFFIILMAVEVGQLVLYSYRRDGMILKLSIVYAVGLFLLNLALIPLFSLWGVAFSLIVMVCVKLLWQKHFIQRCEI